MALPASDTFTATDFTQLATYNPNWTVVAGQFGIHTNGLFPWAATAECAAYWNADEFAADQYVEFDVVSFQETGGYFIGGALRVQSEGANYYVIYSDGQNGSVLGKIVGGSFTELDSAASWEPDDHVRCEAEGTSLRVYVNYVLTMSATDSQFSAGAAGVSGYNEHTNSRIDNWEAGNLSSDTTPPTLTSATATATGETTATASVTTDETSDVYIVVTTSSTTPTAEQIYAGQDHTGSAAAFADVEEGASAGAVPFSVTGLSAGQTYYAHFGAVDLADNDATPVTSSSFTTDQLPAAPSLTATATSWDAIQLDVTVGANTDEVNVYRSTSSPVDPDVDTLVGTVTESGTIFDDELDPDTTYYHLAVASNTDGDTDGTEQETTTWDNDALSTYTSNDPIEFPLEVESGKRLVDVRLRLGKLMRAATALGRTVDFAVAIEDAEETELGADTFEDVPATDDGTEYTVTLDTPASGPQELTVIITPAIQSAE